MLDPQVNLGWQLRERILPSLAELDGVQAELPRIRALYGALLDHDLEFDVRGAPPYPSNLCEQQAALELAYTFGGRDQCGVRYSFEPTCKPGILRNRYTLFRDRMLRAFELGGGGYDRELFLRLFSLGVPRELLRHGTTTVTIGAVHHYRDRPPRLKAYFSCDYRDGRAARQKALELVGALGDDALVDQTRRFFHFYRPLGGMRMVGFDFEPGKPTSVKVYRTGRTLSARGLGRLIDACGGGTAAHAGVRAFQDIFLDGLRSPDELDLITLAPSRRGAPGLKLYVRPVDFYGDGEALRRLGDWYRWLGRGEELRLVLRGLATVAPLAVLEETRGFFNYVSVDVGVEGVTKTSVYYTPQIALGAQARGVPGQAGAGP